MFKRFFSDLAEASRRGFRLESDPETGGANDTSDEEGSKGDLFERKLLFLETIQEKRRIHDENVQLYEEEIKLFDAQAVEYRAEIQVELEKDLMAFFDQAVQIVKQTRDMEEGRTLNKLGLEEPDHFDGNFGFKDIKYSKATMTEVSGIFHPRRDASHLRFRQPTDDLQIICGRLAGKSHKINYDPLNESDFKRFLRHYVGIRKLIARHNTATNMTLDVSNTWVADAISMKLLAEFVWRNPRLFTAVDAANAKGFESRDCLMFMQALKECRGLKTLDFDHTHMCKEGTAALALIAKLSNELEAVSMIDTSMMDAGACFWGLALATGCPVLTSLDLSSCKIGASGAVALAIGLSKHKQLRILNLTNNRVDRQGCQRLGEALLINPILEELNLTGNSIGSRGAASLAAFLIRPECKLKTLILADNDIGRRGGRALSVGMSVNKSLITLDMGMNDLGDIGVAGFGVCLERNSTLKYLDFHDCDITDLGAASLAIGLKTNQTLRSLNLADNVIADAGVAHISRMLGENPSSKLHVLDLSGNAVREIGAEALAEMLKVNTSLTDLKLNDNEIQDEGARLIGEVLRESQNKTLKNLDVSENPISDDVAINYFTKAERRRLTPGTVQLDVIAQGTTMARGNLRGCGVIVLRGQITGLYAIFSATLALFGGWFDFASDIVVAYNTVDEALRSPSASMVYGVLTTLFVIIPFLYVIIVFSLPVDESDVTDNLASIQKNAEKMMQSSSALFSGSDGKSFKEHIRKVANTTCDQERWWLFFINVTQTRVAYEIYLSYKAGMTTLAMSSIRLVEVVFEAIPQSIIQLHIIFSTNTLTKVSNFGGLISPDGDADVALLVMSVAFSCSVLSNTLSSLYEEKFVVNWKKVALANEDLAYWIGFFVSYFYHFSHYLFRSLTITWIASIYGPVLAPSLILFGLLCRLAIHIGTRSRRRKSFAIVSYLVGVAAWDTRKAVRMTVFLELLETIAVIVPLWMPLSQIQQNINDHPLAFQQNWYTMASVIGPIPFTGLLYGCGALSLILYIAFVERVHSYRDVVHDVDPEEAQSLAQSPFEEHTGFVRSRRRKMWGSSGGSVLRSVSGSVLGSSTKLTLRRKKKNDKLSASDKLFEKAAKHEDEVAVAAAQDKV